MAAELFVPPSKALDANANPYAGAKWFFYATGTLTPQSVFTTADLSTPHANPVVADSTGKFANIFFNPALIYRGILKSADESITLHDIDPINTALFSQLLASGGTALVGYIQSGGVATTAQERLRREVWAEDFMTLPAVGDQTAAFQAAIDSLSVNGGTVRFRGDYTIGTTNPIRFPAEPKIVHLLGEGRSILRQGAANAPMIAKVAGVSRVIGAHIKGFQVVAHVDSLKATATNILINIAGFDWSEIDVEYKSNAVTTTTAGRAYAVIAGHANGIPCYNNAVRLEMQQTAGPAKGIWFHNNGGSTLANANVNTVSVWTYALGACDVAVDAADSTQTLVHDSLFEDCAGMTGVMAGNFTKTRDNWFELIGTAINYGQSAVTVANNCVSEHDQFSGENTIVIHSGVAAGPEFTHPLFGAMTFQNQSAAATTNYRVAKTYVQPAAPTISFVTGGGTLSPDGEASARHIVDHHGVITWQTNYIITPAATGRSVIRIAPPTGYEVMQASIAAEDPTDATTAGMVAFGLSTNLAGTDYSGRWPNIVARNLCVRVTMRAV